MSHRQPHAAVRGRPPDRGVVSAVDGVALLGEEDGVGHRRLVPFLGKMVLRHAEGAEVAARRVVLRNSRRYRPAEDGAAGLYYGHLLFAFVYVKEQCRARLRHSKREGGGGQRAKSHKTNSRKQLPGQDPSQAGPGLGQEAVPGRFNARSPLPFRKQQAGLAVTILTVDTFESVRPGVAYAGAAPPPPTAHTGAHRGA